MFLNLHTHSGRSSDSEITINNVMIKDVDDDSLFLKDGSYSVGLHPWYLDPKSYSGQMNRLKEIVNLEGVKMLGECGLDKLRGPEMDLQMRAFTEQVRLAEQAGKPVLIHCVKGYSELLALRKSLQPKVPLIVHGYNGKLPMAIQLIKHGFYISLGHALLIPRSNAGNVLMNIPLSRVFFETDDKPGSVKGIYEKAADLLNISVDELKEIIFGNFLKLRGRI